ncbi:MAG: twin-arginine translocation signal domain-containing protein [Burkholderiales bacterium]
MQRREFIKICAAGAAAAAVTPSFALPNGEPRFYARARLLDQQGRPLKAAALAVKRNYIFHYPFQGTPCFLLNLGTATPAAARLITADGKNYQWQGGVGANKSVVAYSAICAHRLAYPTKQISFISYRGDTGESSVGHANVIHCCAEHSEYDPAQGGKVIGGPAPQPLAAILLEHDQKTDQLFALGTLGGELFNDFFTKYDFKLSLEYGSRAKKPASNDVIVTELTNFCQQQVRC